MEWRQYGRLFFEDPYPENPTMPLFWTCTVCGQRFREPTDLELGAVAQNHITRTHGVLQLPYIIPKGYPAKHQDRNQASPIRRVNPALRWETMKRDGFRCVKCGKSQTDERLEVDHIDPKSNGGSCELKNLQTLCFTCNRGKG